MNEVLNTICFLPEWHCQGIVDDENRKHDIPRLSEVTVSRVNDKFLVLLRHLLTLGVLVVLIRLPVNVLAEINARAVRRIRKR